MFFVFLCIYIQLTLDPSLNLVQHHHHQAPASLLCILYPGHLDVWLGNTQPMLTLKFNKILKPILGNKRIHRRLSLYLTILYVQEASDKERYCIICYQLPIVCTVQQNVYQQNIIRVISKLFTIGYRPVYQRIKLLFSLKEIFLIY